MGLHVLIGELVNYDVYGQRTCVQSNGSFLKITGLGSEWVRKSKPEKRTPATTRHTICAEKNLHRK